ncbi:MAG: neutral zinc metallopeptidase [Deltaproteobacteria bacterium]|nr:neutral zinc metallopeptidase [Deltaproteobacteria bacterium]
MARQSPPCWVIIRFDIHRPSLGEIIMRWRSGRRSRNIEEALNAASAIGDDRLQQQSRGYVTPDSFTHGSPAQRVRWFRQGLETGKVSQCNTFKAENLWKGSLSC